MYDNTEQKRIFAKNLNNLLSINNKSQKEVADFLSINLSTFNSWCTAAKMPRMDKVQLIADYFHVLKSDLIENKTQISEQITYPNDIKEIADFLTTDDNSKLICKITKHLSDDNRSRLLAYAKKLQELEEMEK